MDEREPMEVQDNVKEEPNTKYSPRDFTKWRIRKNLLVVCVAFLLLFTAFMSLQNLQSSLNKEAGMGTISLSIVYVCGMVSGLLLPPFLITRLGCKWTMVISILGYLLFMGANIYPVWGTMIPASILVGLGSAPLWTAKSTYVTKIARTYAKLTGVVTEGCISSFFGFFFMTFQTGLGASPLWTSNSTYVTKLARSYAKLTGVAPGRYISSFFGIFFMTYQSGNIWGNLISSQVFNNDIPREVNKTEHMPSICGADYCPGNYRNNTNLDRPNLTKIYTVCGVFISCGFFAMVIMAAFLDRLPEDESKSNKSSKSLILAALHHFWNSRYQKLLVPLIIYTGVAKAFIAGDFTRSFVSCSLGIWNVGYVMIVFGAANATTSFVVGRLVSIVGFSPMFILWLFVHGGALITLLLWNPVGQPVYIFYILSCMLGMGDAIGQTMMNALHGQLFPDNLEAGFTSNKIGEALGFTISFGYSSFLCTDVKIYVTLTLLVCGLVLYAVVDVMYRLQTSKIRKYKSDSQDGEAEAMNTSE